jgi:uncharacterized membrane protein YebE (DUF533 family)
MADLRRLLGGMLASGMGGRSRRGPAFAASPFLGRGRSSGSSFGQTAGLAALGYLGYKAWQEFQKGSGGASGGSPSPAPPPEVAKRNDGGSLGERLGSMLGMGGARPEPEPEPESLADDKAMLLIRAMIAAANADGEISSDERRTITGRLDQAGAGPEERAVLERELQAPRSVDQIVRDVHDPETAEQVYLASRLAMNPDTAAEKAYLDFLASRLEIPAGRRSELDTAA